jgi:hypothetical protein
MKTTECVAIFHFFVTSMKVLHVSFVVVVCCVALCSNENGAGIMRVACWTTF